jgi:hypothetical protein
MLWYYQHDAIITHPGLEAKAVYQHAVTKKRAVVGLIENLIVTTSVRLLLFALL